MTILSPEQAETGYTRVLNRSILDTFSLAMRVIGSDPSLLAVAGRLVRHQKKAEKLRKNHARQGIPVPPVIMLSMTHRCNLTCHGCYMQAQHRNETGEMSLDQLRTLVSEASVLGVSFLVLAGGEPMVRIDDILVLAREFPDMIIAVYTNGTMIDQPTAEAIGRLKNLVPVISIEGDRHETDARRSQGVYASALKAFSRLMDEHIFFGCSVTVTRSNVSDVTDEGFIRNMIQEGCRLITYVEYVPVQSGTSELVLTDLQHDDLVRQVTRFSGEFPALFLSFPGDEELFGGCLSAGRGFVHISPSGDLEPCPAAPFSDVNVTRIPLREALKSEFLGRVREQHGMLTESGGGCALWKNRDQVMAMLIQG